MYSHVCICIHVHVLDWLMALSNTFGTKTEGEEFNMDSSLTSFPTNPHLVHCVTGTSGLWWLLKEFRDIPTLGFCFTLLLLELTAWQSYSFSWYLCSYLLTLSIFQHQTYPDVFTLFSISFLAFLHCTSFIYLLCVLVISTMFSPLYKLHHSRDICQFYFLIYLFLEQSL